MSVILSLFNTSKRMGQSISQQINDDFNLAIQVTNNQTQKCRSTATTDDIIEICNVSQNCPNGSVNVNISDNDLKQTVVYSTECSSDVNINNSVQNDISQTFAQQAANTAQQFGLSEQDINEVTNIALDIGVTITSNNVNSCYAEATSNAGIALGCGPGGQGGCNINITGNQVTQEANLVNNCLLRVASTSSIINKVTQTISQKGTNTVQSLFGPLVYFILIIFIIVGVMLYQGEKALLDYRLWLVVVLFIFIYIGIAAALSWFPFDNKEKQ